MHRPTVARAPVLSVLALALLATGMSGCGRPDADVAAVAERFYEAVESQDGATACAQLSPRTTSELEKSAGKPCDRAILEEDVPQVGSSPTVRVFGSQAEVKHSEDTAFLARFPAGWKVMAAVCTPVPDMPYDCSISGG